MAFAISLGNSQSQSLWQEEREAFAGAAGQPSGRTMERSITTALRAKRRASPAINPLTWSFMHLDLQVVAACRVTPGTD